MNCEQINFTALFELRDKVASSNNTAGIKERLAQLFENPDFDILTEKHTEIKKNAYGFFTPYKNLTDFRKTLLAPILTPLELGYAASITIIITAIGAIIAAGSLVFAIGAGIVSLFNENASQSRINASVLACAAAFSTVVTAVIAVALAVITAISLPWLVAQIFTRSGATAISAISNCFSNQPTDKQCLSLFNA